MNVIVYISVTVTISFVTDSQRIYATVPLRRSDSQTTYAIVPLRQSDSQTISVSATVSGS